VEEGGWQALKTLAILVALLVTSSSVLAQATLGQLSGQWVVDSVQLRRATAQALTADDPNYIGAVLEVSGQRLAWVYRPGGELDDTCIGPRWNGAVVECIVGSFGPSGSALTYMGDQLRLEWYDNAILTLQRVK